MFDNQIIDENKNTELSSEKSSLSVSFTDEQLVSGNTDDDEIKKIIEEEENQKEEKQAVFNSFLAFKTKVEQMLNDEDYEDIVVNFVDQMLLDEQNALTDETLKKIKLKKYIAGLVFMSANCYGDQHNFLLLMADRLGVRG